MEVSGQLHAQPITRQKGESLSLFDRGREQVGSGGNAMSCIREVFGSNLQLDTFYRDRYFRVFSQALQ
jgi:hypothetical protein